MRIVSLILFVFAFYACSPELENKKSELLYFDMKDMLNKQVELLGKRVRVQKFIRHDKQRENNTLEVSNWQQELKIFEEANLNRPIYKNLYEQKDSATQDIKYVTFTAKKTGLQVRQMRLGYEKSVLRSLEAKLLIKNIMYESEKQLKLTFAPDSVLNGYSIKGNFNVVYGAKHDYEIDAVVKGRQGAE